MRCEDKAPRCCRHRVQKKIGRYVVVCDQRWIQHDLNEYGVEMFLEGKTGKMVLEACYPQIVFTAKIFLQIWDITNGKCALIQVFSCIFIFQKLQISTITLIFHSAKTPSVRPQSRLQVRGITFCKLASPTWDCLNVSIRTAKAPIHGD